MSHLDYVYATFMFQVFDLLTLECSYVQISGAVFATLKSTTGRNIPNKCEQANHLQNGLLGCTYTRGSEPCSSTFGTLSLVHLTSVITLYRALARLKGTRSVELEVPCSVW